MSNFRTAYIIDEQDTIIKSVKELNKEKINGYLLNAVIFGAIYIMFVGLFVGLKSQDVNEVRRYSGSRPVFEDYEEYIMTRFFSCETHVDDGWLKYLRDNVDSEDYFLYMIAGVPEYTYTQVMEPEEYDFASLDFRKINKSYVKLYPSLPKDTSMYKEAAKKAKELFEEELDKRDAAAKVIINKQWSILAGLIALYIIGAVLLDRLVVRKNCQNRLTEAEKYICTVCSATLIGREKEWRYRRSSALYLEVETEEGERFKQRVNSMQYNSFESNAPCLLVKYKNGYGTYDEYDIVWKGLINADNESDM